ncbi:MAG: sigma-54-dependent transcriptional regulator [Holosporales bacterium]
MRLLIVGSLEGHIATAGKIALARGAKVAHVNDPEQALRGLRAGQGSDLIMVDVKQPVDKLIEMLAAERFHIPVVACGIGANADEAVAAIKAGAKEYIPLPPDPELIAAVLEAVTQENHTVVHRDPATAKVLKLADQIAPSEASVLITGESGTGKEVFARYIHKKSKRANAAFISINCAAIPENLLESELFGHEKGAFTGALARRVGKFEEANGGTLLLDEVTEMHPRLQAKLLRAIQEREIDRVGGATPVKVNIRLIATSNRNMEQAVKEGIFREDLYFRLNVFTLHLPSLRERRGDIAPLADYFIEKYATANAVKPLPLSSQALEKLLAHQWRGNIRELENTMHRAVLLASGDSIGIEAIMLTGAGESPLGGSTTAATPVASSGGASTPLVGRTVEAVERELIVNTLEHCLGNRTHAANILGISIRTLRNKLKQYSDEGVAVPPHQESGVG